MIRSGRTRDLGLGAVIAAQLGASLLLTRVGDQVVLPGGARFGALCWFRATFGIECPFCGMTRSFVSLAHGDIASAFRFHPAGPLLFAAMVVGLFAIAVVTVRRGQPLVERRGFMLAVEALVVGCLMIGVAHVVRR